MSVMVLKMGLVLSTMAMLTNWMSRTLPSLVGLDQMRARPGKSEKFISVLHPGLDERWQVFSSVSDVEGKCVCTLLTPPQIDCQRDSQYHRLRQLTEHTGPVMVITYVIGAVRWSILRGRPSVLPITFPQQKMSDMTKTMVFKQWSNFQNLTQDLELLDLQTSRDLQHIRNSEKKIIAVETRCKTAFSNFHALTDRDLKDLERSVFEALALRAVLLRFRSDLLKLDWMKRELEVVISSVTQEQTHRYSSFPQLLHREALLQDRLHTCISTTGCGKLLGISNPVTIRSLGSRFGSWMMESMISSSDERVWSMEGYHRGRRMLEYRSLSDFTKGEHFVVHQLPHPWAGTGHVIYNGSLYYNKHQTNDIIRYHLLSHSVLAQRPLSQAAYNNTFPYSWGGSSDIDLMADESGLWAVYTTLGHGGNVMLSRLDPITLDSLRSWDTGFPKRSAGEAFVVCGSLYVTDSHLHGAKIHFVYHTDTETYEYTHIPFHNKYSHISMMDYNPREKVLYAWNNGHQVIYNITLLHEISGFRGM